MVLIVRHPVRLNKRFHAVQHGRQFKIALFAGNRALVVQINLYIFIIIQEIQHFINRVLFLLISCHDRPLEVIAGVQHVFVLIIACRKYKRVNVDIRICGFNLRNRVAADDIHRRFAARKRSTRVIIAVCERVRLCILQQRLCNLRNRAVFVRKFCRTSVHLCADCGIRNINGNRIPWSQTSPYILEAKIQRLYAFFLDILTQGIKFVQRFRNLPAVFLEHFPVVKHACGIRHIWHRINAFLGYKFQFLVNTQIGFLDIRQPGVIRNIHQHIRI